MSTTRYTVRLPIGAGKVTCCGSVHPMTDACLPSAGALNSFPTVESRQAKDPCPRGCWVPGEMHILVWTIRGTLAWANRVSNDVIPGTTEHPISASIPCGAACDSTRAY